MSKCRVFLQIPLGKIVEKGKKFLCKKPNHTAGGDTGGGITLSLCSSSSQPHSSCIVDYLGLKNRVLAKIFPSS